MKLRAINKEEIEIVRKWRNEDLSYLRTPFVLTQEMQEEFYINTICNRLSDCRFWAVEEKNIFVAIVGFVSIHFQNRNAEISMILDPFHRGKGIGDEAFFELLKKGFNEINLENIYGECYMCNPSIKFWKKMIDKYKGIKTELPERKYYDGKMYDSIFFNFKRGCIC